MVVADEKSSFYHAISGHYHVPEKNRVHWGPLWTSKLELAGFLLLTLASIVSVTAGCLQCWTSAKRLQLLVVRTSNLLCATLWAVLCWEQLSSFPDSMLALAVCALAATAHVAVICAQRGQCSFPELVGYSKAHLLVEKTLSQDEENAEVTHNPVLIISRKTLPRSASCASSAQGLDCDTCSMSECLILDSDNMPGTVVVPKSGASSEKVAKFYQSKLLCVADDKSKDM